MTEELRRTPLFDEHRRLGARIVPFAGWEMPIQYAGIASEHRSVRERAGLFDVSHMGELWIEGPSAAEVVNELVTNDLGRIDDGRAMYTCCCNTTGGILDDLIVYRLSKERVLVVCNASNRDKIAGHFRTQTAERASFRDASDETCLIAFQGPRVFEVLKKLGTTFDESFKSFRVREHTLAERHCLFARTGYTGEDGVEIFCSHRDAVPIWTALLEGGAADEVAPIGLGARDTLRLEARLALYGNDIDESTNPIEAGLGWTVKLDKSSFVGKEALQSIDARGPNRTLVGFEMTGRGIARHGYSLLNGDGEIVGACTSGAPSPTLGKNIGLGYLPVELAAVGTDFQVDCRGKSIAARVVRTPFYKRRRAS